mmetsp:Transcript_12052/g.18492  ORF Transcript_12052/g.18492 Transcript_12052/m.18492 type:complete len:145 (-) Transcript_12052:129-563(-)|eukprot:CAMPEP_0178919056 /NCGR_PEP_ID=MMETSP0786-20121207/14204_1 /TAXON_ID=186022 /ORGANISM="Thalassionema frauenfeldii, Strain CCMP 1798" /LENGTH=144 /DNA_ID=CAMNT_0020592903 /DNA_START=24 /DNA_END=458 /DNA_ORIENTATION=+
MTAILWNNWNILFALLFHVCIATPPPLHPIGGYHDANPIDERIKEVSKFALMRLSDDETVPYNNRLRIVDSTQVGVSILKAQKQVVAGMNYRLTLEITEGGECVGAFDVEIYDHFGDISISHWGKEYLCKEAAEMKQKAAEDED